MKGTCNMPIADCGSHIIVGTDKEVTEGRGNRSVEYDLEIQYIYKLER
jgi:hypothetical protein